VKVPPTRSGNARIWDGPIPGTHEPGYREQPIRELPWSLELQHIVHGDSVAEQLHAFTMGDCRIILGREPQGVHGEMRWHLSISCSDRHPTWDEIKTARYRLLGPDTVMAMLLPQVQHYVNVATQDHVFQLWEVDDPARVWEVT